MDIKKLKKSLAISITAIIVFKLIAIIVMKKTLFTTSFSDVIDNYDGVEKHLFDSKKEDLGR